MIQEILITVTPFIEWLSSVVQGVVITVTPYLEWLNDSADVIITVTPDFGVFSWLMVASAFFLVFAMDEILVWN